MPVYRIHRLRVSHRQQFRWAAHTSGVTGVKPKDYDEIGSVEAPGVYAAWTESREKGQPLEVGDLLEGEDGQLRICKYVGFEEARWALPEAEPESEPAAVAAGSRAGDLPSARLP
jgi:hypothetical protein